MTERTYRLSPPDRTGWFLGLGGPQVLTLGSALVVGAILVSFGVPLALVGPMVAAAGVGSLVRAGGRPLIEWLPSAWRWWRRRRHDQAWLAPVVAINAEPPSTPALPPPLDGQVVIQTLLAAAEAAFDDGQYFSQGADRSAALGLPIVLTTQPLAGAASINDVEAALLGLAQRSSVETRTYLAVALGRVFRHPCSTGSRCVHLFTRDVLVETARRSALGPWNQETQRLDLRALEGPLDQWLESVDAEELTTRSPIIAPCVRWPEKSTLKPRRTSRPCLNSPRS